MPEGGTLTIDDATVTLPPAAVAADTTLRATAVTEIPGDLLDDVAGGATPILDITLDNGQLTGDITIDRPTMNRVKRNGKQCSPAPYRFASQHHCYQENARMNMMLRTAATAIAVTMALTACTGTDTADPAPTSTSTSAPAGSEVATDAPVVVDTTDVDALLASMTDEQRAVWTRDDRFLPELGWVLAAYPDLDPMPGLFAQNMSFGEGADRILHIAFGARVDNGPVTWSANYPVVPAEHYIAFGDNNGNPKDCEGEFPGGCYVAKWTSAPIHPSIDINDVDQSVLDYLYDRDQNGYIDSDDISHYTGVVRICKAQEMEMLFNLVGGPACILSGSQFLDTGKLRREIDASDLTEGVDSDGLTNLWIDGFCQSTPTCPNDAAVGVTGSSLTFRFDGVALSDSATFDITMAQAPDTTKGIRCVNRSAAWDSTQAACATYSNAGSPGNPTSGFVPVNVTADGTSITITLPITGARTENIFDNTADDDVVFTFTIDSQPVDAIISAGRMQVLNDNGVTYRMDFAAESAFTKQLFATLL